MAAGDCRAEAPARAQVANIPLGGYERMSTGGVARQAGPAAKYVIYCSRES